MSGLAIFRPSPQYEDLSKLAQEHFDHDLSPEDKSALRAASRKVSRHTAIGSLVGLGLGVYAAVKLRRVRANVLAALRTAEKPVKVVFADGRTGRFLVTPGLPEQRPHLFSRPCCEVDCCQVALFADYEQSQSRTCPST